MMLSFPFSLFRAQAAMQAEIIALCHQVIVLQRTQKTWDFQQTQMAVVAGATRFHAVSLAVPSSS